MYLKLTVSSIISICDLYSAISDFQKGYQPRTNIGTDEKADLVTDSHSILARWMKHFSQLFNVHGVSDVKQTEIHTAESLVRELSSFDQIPAELIKSGCITICSEILNHINSILNKEELREEWNASIIVPIYKKGDETGCRNGEAYHFRQLCTKFYPTSCCKDYLYMQRKFLDIIGVDFDA